MEQYDVIWFSNKTHLSDLVEAAGAVLSLDLACDLFSCNSRALNLCSAFSKSFDSDALQMSLSCRGRTVTLGMDRVKGCSPAEAGRCMAVCVLPLS